MPRRERLGTGRGQEITRLEVDALPIYGQDAQREGVLTLRYVVARVLDLREDQWFT